MACFSHSGPRVARCHVDDAAPVKFSCRFIVSVDDRLAPHPGRLRRTTRTAPSISGGTRNLPAGRFTGDSSRERSHDSAPGPIVAASPAGARPSRAASRHVVQEVGRSGATAVATSPVRRLACSRDPWRNLPSPRAGAPQAPSDRRARCKCLLFRRPCAGTVERATAFVATEVWGWG